jgi:hypothetical protein
MVWDKVGLAWRREVYKFSLAYWFSYFGTRWDLPGGERYKSLV